VHEHERLVITAHGCCYEDLSCRCGYALVIVSFTKCTRSARVTRSIFGGSTLMMLDGWGGSGRMRNGAKTRIWRPSMHEEGQHQDSFTCIVFCFKSWHRVLNLSRISTAYRLDHVNTCFVNNASSISIPLYVSAQIFHKSRTVDATSTTHLQATSLHLHILAYFHGLSEEYKLDICNASPSLTALGMSNLPVRAQ
jgi:hypothetical protein